MTDKELNATDLMIGDWVRWTSDQWLTKEDAQPIMVKAVRENEIQVIGRNNWYVCSLIEPVPLTAEILAQNGFSKSRLMGEQRHFTYYIGPRLELCAIYDADFSFPIGDDARKILYVHQLQHLLRLCNINKEIKL